MQSSYPGKPLQYWADFLHVTPREASQRIVFSILGDLPRRGVYLTHFPFFLFWGQKEVASEKVSGHRKQE